MVASVAIIGPWKLSGLERPVWSNVLRRELGRRRRKFTCCSIKVETTCVIHGIKTSLCNKQAYNSKLHKGEYCGNKTVNYGHIRSYRQCSHSLAGMIMGDTIIRNKDITMFQGVISCHVMSCHVMSCHVMSCHVMSCHVMSCHVMSCYITLCYVMSSGCCVCTFQPTRYGLYGCCWSN